VSLSISDFWRVLAESRLLAPHQVQQLASEFAQTPGAAQAAAKSVGQWLVGRNVLSRYQAMILLAGRSGPFHYGDYKVYDRIEQGRLAGIFRAVHAASGHPVMLKFLTGPVVSQPALWAAAASSTQAASRIASPQVQRYFEAVDLQTFKFVVSEDLRGSTLDERLGSSRLPPAEACRIARLAAIGLAQMHASGRVHGEVQPANLFLEAAAGKQSANVKMLFEATQLPGPLDLSQQQAGSPLANMADYLAPELAAPESAPDPLTDLYALGCTLYAMLAGKPPFAGGEVQQKLARHATEPIRPLEKLGVPQPLMQLVSYLMAKNPTVRYQSASLVVEQLAMFIEPAALRIELPAPPPPTLGAFEQFLRQKQPAASPMADARMPVVTTGGARLSPPFQTDRDRFAAVAAAVAAPVAVAPPAAPAVGINLQTKTRGSGRADEIMRRRQAAKRRNLRVSLAAVLILAIGGAAGGVFYWQQQKSHTSAAAAAGHEAPAAETTTAPGKSATVTPASAHAAVAGKGKSAGSGEGSSSSASPAGSGSTGEGGLHQNLVADDGKSLWASPTTGKPVSFRCLPPEGQVFLFVRPAAMLASSEGPRVLAALGPALEAQRKSFEAASGFPLEAIEQLHVTLHNNDAQFPRASFVVKTKDAVPREQLLERWGKPMAALEKGETYYAGSTWAYYIPHSPEDERTFAMGEVRDIKDVAAAAGAPPAVFRDIERLRRATDNDRHFTLLFYPQFLFNDDGEPLFAGERAKVRQPLAWFLGEHLQAACVSGNFGDEFYFEMRMLASLDKEPYQLAQELRERMDKIPAALEDYFLSLNPPTYWKKLAFRYPGMVRELHAQMRTGVENDQAIVNSVLPQTAAHNLVLGGELLVATTPGQAASVVTAPAATGPKTIAEALQIKTSYSFDNQSLEFAMRDLAEDVKGNLKGVPFEFAIKIIGDDLKIDGITRNQSVRDFKQENQTVADILTALVRKANPVTTVKDPSETDQKLIWVIGPDPDSPGKQIVLITTRTAAATKKYALPAVFVAKK
jgi:hypothetical protein